MWNQQIPTIRLAALLCPPSVYSQEVKGGQLSLTARQDAYIYPQEIMPSIGSFGASRAYSPMRIAATY